MHVLSAKVEKSLGAHCGGGVLRVLLGRFYSPVCGERRGSSLAGTTCCTARPRTTIVASVGAAFGGTHCNYRPVCPVPSLTTYARTENLLRNIRGGCSGSQSCAHKCRHCSYLIFTLFPRWRMAQVLCRWNACSPPPAARSPWTGCRKATRDRLVCHAPCGLRLAAPFWSLGCRPVQRL